MFQSDEHFPIDAASVKYPAISKSKNLPRKPYPDLFYYILHSKISALLQTGYRRIMNPENKTDKTVKIS